MTASTIARHSVDCSLLVNANKPSLYDYTRYNQNLVNLHSILRTHGAQQLQQLLPYNNLHPVGTPRMPSQTIHFPEEMYEQIVTTKADGQSTSARVAELVSKGLKEEDNGQ